MFDSLSLTDNHRTLILAPMLGAPSDIYGGPMWNVQLAAGGGAVFRLHCDKAVTVPENMDQVGTALPDRGLQTTWNQPQPQRQHRCR